MRLEIRKGGATRKKKEAMSTPLHSVTSSSRPQLLKVFDVAALLNVKPRTIYEMVAQHRIPYRKPPGTNILRFDLDEILAWTRGENSK
jgi:excisionase family DNA binding protein